MKIIFVFFIYFLQTFCFAQKNNANEIINKVKAEFEKIDDYIVDIQVKLDISYIQIPDVNAKLYYKKPNKMQIESKNFAILPKQGLTINPLNFLESEYTAICDDILDLNGSKNFQVKIIPKETEKGPSLIILLVDCSSFTISRMTSIGGKQGKTELDFEYLKLDQKYWLPKKIIVTADIGNFRNHRFQSQQPNNQQKTDDKNSQKSGKVYLMYSNYIINQGIDDKIFKSEIKDKQTDKFK